MCIGVTESRCYALETLLSQLYFNNIYIYILREKTKGFYLAKNKTSAVLSFFYFLAFFIL